MVSKAGFSRLGKVYLWSIIVAGTYVISRSLHQLYVEPIGYQWFILAALTLISGSATVKLPSSYASISISETFVFTAVLLYGPAAGTVIVVLDALVISFWISKRHDEPHRALFNISAPAISAWTSAHVFFQIAKVSPLVKEPSSLNAILPALIVFALTYFWLNSWLITFVIALERRLNPIRVWSSTFVWLSLNYFGGASVAILFVGYNRTIDLGYVGVIVPLLLVLWFTFKTTMGRVEDADRHVEQLNRLYLSTIETLAMAIDAKDQVTHGHIRRVQTYATNLARAVGVREERSLKAIEAAALLHDMGKLAVPEYILNKPGKLSDAEFAKMKLHASVGAEILSAIDFPYPVVPIVRHHHENWDGSGYPDGLRGTDIPIGARILSVVDCFDALTSDRPYRPRLTDLEAITILQERRGTMYDPLIVDSFLKIHSEIAPQSVHGKLSSSALNEIASARQSLPAPVASPVLDEITASANEMLTLYDLAGDLGVYENLSDAADMIAQHVRRLVPSSLYVFFRYDELGAELEAAHAVGEGASLAKGLRIKVGQRLSGWVAANRQTILNSDPVLDLGDMARNYPAGRLRSCVSTPLVTGGELYGVLSLYSREANAFSENHRRVIEAVANQVAHTLRRISHSTPSSIRDDLFALPNIDELTKAVASGHRAPKGRVLLVVKLRSVQDIMRKHGRSAAEESLHYAIRSIREKVHASDVIFRISPETFAVLLSADLEAAKESAEHLRHALSSQRLNLQNGETLTVEATVYVTPEPGDRKAISDLLNSLRSQEVSTRNASKSTSVH